jgi:hypothetical protein
VIPSALLTARYLERVRTTRRTPAGAVRRGGQREATPGMILAVMSRSRSTSSSEPGEFVDVPAGRGVVEPVAHRRGGE